MWLMKYKPWIARAALAASCTSLLAGCGSMPAQPDMRMGAPAHVVTSTTPFTAVERDFVTRVATANVYEIEVSKLAADKATSPAVREYAQNMVRQHGQMNNELLELMSAHGVAPPRSLPASKATKLHRLAALPASDAFDNGYIRVVGIEDHRSEIAMFEKARGQVRDRDLRAFIDRSLTIMRVHLTAAQQVAGSLAS
jgi:putative membrane protein